MNEEQNPDFVLIIGSSNMDLNIYTERFPKPGETVTGGTFNQFLGGKGANQAVASIRSGAPTYFIGKIGMDMFGDQMVESLSSEGINTYHIIRDSEYKSGVAFILIDSKGENMIAVAPGANKNLSVSEIKNKKELIQNAKVIVVQMEIPLNVIESIFKIASEKEVIKILNPAPLRPFPKELLKYIDIIIPNEGELLRLHSIFKLGELPTNENEKIVRVSEKISELGVKSVITTLGSKGCLLYDKNEGIYSISAFPVKAIDSVGAGDCFNGVLASKLCRGESLLTAIKYANSAASIAVTRKGAQESMPFFDEIERRYQEFTNNMVKKW